MVEQVLLEYRKLKNKEKAFKTCYDAGIETMKAVSYNSIGEGKRSCKYITGNTALEFAVIEKDELLHKIEDIKKSSDEILFAVEDLKKEKNGEEMYQIIKMRYLEKKSFNEVQGKMFEIFGKSTIEIATIHRRKNQALQILHEKGLWALFYKLNLDKKN